MTTYPIRHKVTYNGTLVDASGVLVNKQSRLSVHEQIGGTGFTTLWHHDAERLIRVDNPNFYNKALFQIQNDVVDRVDLSGRMARLRNRTLVHTVHNTNQARTTGSWVRVTPDANITVHEATHGNRWVTLYHADARFYFYVSVDYFYVNYETGALPNARNIRLVIEDAPLGNTAAADSSTTFHNSTFLNAAGRQIQMAIVQRQFLESFVPKWALDAMGSNLGAVTAYLNQLHAACTTAGSLNLLDKKDLCWVDLVTQLPHDITPFAGMGGIYIQIYWGFEGADADMVLIIIGSTWSFSNRSGQHARNMTRPEIIADSTHYKQAIKAKYWAFRVLAASMAWGESGLEAFRQRLRPEQLFLNLFASTRPDVLVSGARTEWTVDESFVPADGEIPGDLFDVVNEKLDMNAEAAAWDRVSSEANRRAGWTPFTKRTTFFRVSRQQIQGYEWTTRTHVLHYVETSRGRGLNRASPLSTAGESTRHNPHTWLLSSFINSQGVHVDNYTRVVERSPWLNTKGATGMRLMWFKGLGDTGSDRSLTAVGTLALTTRDKVRICIEVRRDGRPHGLAWSSHPIVSRFYDVDLCRSFAVKISRASSTGGREEAYLQNTMPHAKYKSGHVRGEFSSYCFARSVLRYLQQQVVVKGSNHHHPADSDYGRAHVRKITYDKFNQKITVGNVTQGPSTASIPSSNVVSDDVLKQRMEQAGCQNVGRRFVTMVESLTRKKCDCCVVNCSICEDFQEAGRSLSGEPLYACKAAREKGIFSSWTPGLSSQMGGGLRAALANNPALAAVHAALGSTQVEGTNSWSIARGAVISVAPAGNEDDPSGHDEDELDAEELEKITNDMIEKWESKTYD